MESDRQKSEYRLCRNCQCDTGHINTILLNLSFLFCNKDNNVLSVVVRVKSMVQKQSAWNIKSMGTQQKFSWDAWVAQLVKCLTLDFSSGYDLTVCGFEPRMGFCTDSAEPAWNFLSPSLSAPPLLTHALSLSNTDK